MHSVAMVCLFNFSFKKKKKKNYFERDNFFRDDFSRKGRDIFPQNSYKPCQELCKGTM